MSRPSRRVDSRYAAMTRRPRAMHLNARHGVVAPRRRARHARFAGTVAPLLPLVLHTARQRSVDYEVRSARVTRGGAGEKDDAAADLLRFRHPTGRIQGERLAIEVGQVVFYVVPDAALEIGVAWRNRIDPDHLRRVLIGKSLRVMNERRFDRAISRAGEVDLAPGDRGDDDDRGVF